MAERLQTIARHLNSSCSGQCTVNKRVHFNGVQSASTVFSAKNYQFTVGGGQLTSEQRKFYEDNGYLVIKNLVPKEKLAIYRARFQDMCTGKVNTTGMTVMRDIAIAKSEFKDDERAISKLQDFQWDDVLFGFCQLPQVIDYVTDIIGSNVMSMHTMLINKPPDPGTLTSRHPMHQDLHYFPFRPADKVVCVWTAMQTINRSNGCLVVVPGTHTGVLMEHDYPKWEGGVNKMYHGLIDYDPQQNERIWLEMEEGDSVFFHPLLIHGSGTNRTNGFRKSISCHYAASECEYIDTDRSQQENIANEVLELVRKKIATDNVSYADVWRYRARLVNGQRINL